MFDIFIIVIAGYALISQNYVVMPYLIFFEGVMLLVMGIDEMKKERKISGVFIVAISLFSFYVALLISLN